MGKVCGQLFKVETSDEIEIIMMEILPMFYNSVKFKSLSENYDITQQTPVWIFRNLTNLFFHSAYMVVTFMSAKSGWLLIPSNMNYFHYHMIHILKNHQFLVSIRIQCLFAFKLNYYATIR